MGKKVRKIKTESISCSGLKPSKYRGFSCKKEVMSAKVFIATHRARSKAYDSLGDIPISAQKFIDSTG